MLRIIFTIVALLVLLPKASLAQEATKAGETVREKVQEKIEATLKSPRAYVGTVTDIAKETIEIKNPSSEIQQISVDPEKTSFVKIEKGSKAIEFGDIAIGDFVIAMGYKNGNAVLAAKRVLLTEAFKPDTRRTLLATIGAIDSKKKTIDVVGAKDQKDYVVEAKSASIFDIRDGKLTEIKLTELAEDQKIVVIGPISGNTVEARFMQTTENVPNSSTPPKPSPTPTPSPSPTPEP